MQPDFSLSNPRLWFHRARIERVLNGDTVLALVDRGFTDFSLMKFRLAGVDADGNRDAEQRLAELVEGQEVLIKTGRTAKLDRWLVTIYLPPDWRESANELLLAEGLVSEFSKPRQG